MSDLERTNSPTIPVATAAPEPPEPPLARPRVKWFRLLLLLIPLGLLAVVSTVFGMMMAVASDLPDLENRPEYRDRGGARNSVMVDVRGETLGLLASNQNRIILQRSGDISPWMKFAIIAVEDQRFYENSGVDLRGIARAFVNDVIKGGARQGGSTITQQFVKNALEAQDQRTVFQKLRESAMAYHLTRKWSKEKILREYLNSIYFGNGAYGVEAAARTYFGSDPNHLGCGNDERPCAKELEPQEAALLAGIVASPSGYDPQVHPRAALLRRNLVLDKMLAQGRLTPVQHTEALAQALPGDISPPRVESKAPYFTSWVRQQLVDKFGARRAFEGGLRVRTTLDLQLQEQAQRAVNTYLANPGGPTAALVAIDNDTGEVRAMVGGRDYDSAPFNLATQGQRQPGSSFKPFILAEALRRGIGPGSLWPSRKREFTVPNTGGREKFVVNNFEDAYSGVSTLARGLTFSDNSVYAAVGIKVGTDNVSRLARRMGIRTPVSTNYAMTLGGLKQGVTPLDMAHAYETFARKGRRVYGTLGTSQQGPVAIREVEVRETNKCVKIIGGDCVKKNKTRTRRILSPQVATTAASIMSTVVSSGSGKRAAIPGTFVAGKTGTTENFGDAWFVGFTDRMTVAVWVGYPDKLIPMETEFMGEPVAGGTFPALIWREFMISANRILDARVDAERKVRGLPPLGQTTTVPAAAQPGTTVPATPDADVPDEGAEPGGAAPKTPATPAPEPEPEPEPAPTPAPAPTEPTPGTSEDGGPGGAAPPPG
jgi:penicillin-binding protein 1A